MKDATSAHNRSLRDGVRPGWRALYDRLCDDLDRIDPTPRVRCAVEKAAALRVSADGDTRDLTWSYEERSRRVCDECGAPGQTLSTADGWFATRCPEHATGGLAVRRSPWRR